MTTAPTAAHTPAEPAGVDASAQRLFAAGLAAVETLNVDLGVRLGLYEVLARHGPGPRSSWPPEPGSPSATRSGRPPRGR